MTAGVDGKIGSSSERYRLAADHYERDRYVNFVWPVLSVAIETEPAGLTPATGFDLGRVDSLAVLRRIDAVWSQRPVQAWLRHLQAAHIVLPPRAVGQRDVALLPGGAVVIRDPVQGVLVCDPSAAATFPADAASRMRTRATLQPDTRTLSHGRAGVALRRGLPGRLRPQTVSIVSEASDLAECFDPRGPVLVQWFAGGATAWPLVPAPPLLALAASVSATPVGARGAAAPPSVWDASGLEPRARLLSPGITEHVSDVLAAELSDDMRFAFVELLGSGNDCLTTRIAAALAVLPACFRGDPSAHPGEPPTVWQSCLPWLRSKTAPKVLLGVEALGEPRRAVRALRRAMGDSAALVFAATSARQECAPLELASDGAFFLAQRLGARERLGVLLEPPAGVPELYALAAKVAERVGASVTAAAPCWGLCHRVGPAGEEAGNVAWFGMGAGLDELDDVLCDGEDWG